VSCLVNPAVDPGAVPQPATEATAFHAGLPGYRPTPLRPLSAELGLGSVALKDESDRLGLPSFKVLGAEWSIERTLRERPATDTLVAASAGNHGRAVAHVAAARRAACAAASSSRRGRRRPAARPSPPRAPRS
jgi:diaminopropionate ammonia-lyase